MKIRNKLIFSAWLAAYACGAHAVSYTTVDLGIPAGSSSGAGGYVPFTASYASGINNAGQVSGTLSGYASTAFVTDAGGTGMRILTYPPGGGSPTFGGPGTNVASYANSINNSGQVAGAYTTGQGYYYQFTTGANAAGFNSVAIGWLNIAAQGINDAGHTAGDGWSGAATNAYIIDANGYRSLNTLGGNYGVAYAINNTDQVAGWSNTASGAQHAFITGAGGAGVRDLGTLGGNNSMGYRINDAGQVVGWANTASGAQHAFITGANGGAMTDLGTLGGTNSVAAGVNITGQAVGWANTAGGAQHGFLWQNGTMFDMNSFLGSAMVNAGWVVTTGAAINDNGWIAADATNSLTGQTHAFLFQSASAVPEPGEWALMLAGFGLIGYMRKRTLT